MRFVPVYRVGESAAIGQATGVTGNEALRDAKLLAEEDEQGRE